MGIRFRCHHCEHELNLKEFQAGRRARCPACSGRFRVPTASADFSVPLDDQESELAATNAGVNVGAQQASVGAVPFDLRPSSADPDIAAIKAASANSLAPAAGKVPMPAAIKEAPQAIWYVRPPSGGQYGPAEGQLFNDWLQDNRVSADSLVWRDGWAQWQLAGDVFIEYFGADWRLAQESATSSTDDDTLDSPLSDSSAEVSPLANSPANFETTAPVISNIALTRRKKKQTTYGIFIGILALLAIVLLGVLLSVIF